MHVTLFIVEIGRWSVRSSFRGLTVCYVFIHSDPRPLYNVPFFFYFGNKEGTWVGTHLFVRKHAPPLIHPILDTSSTPTHLRNVFDDTIIDLWYYHPGQIIPRIYGSRQNLTRTVRGRTRGDVFFRFSNKLGYPFFLPFLHNILPISFFTRFLRLKNFKMEKNSDAKKV